MRQVTSTPDFLFRAPAVEKYRDELLKKDETKPRQSHKFGIKSDGESRHLLFFM